MSKQVEKGNSYLLSTASSDSLSLMFSHIVIFWTKPEVENSEQLLIDGLNHYLPDIPGVVSMPRIPQQLQAAVHKDKDVSLMLSSWPSNGSPSDNETVGHAARQSMQQP